MIVCPNCSHHNPDGAIQCEACYTPLPALMSCPSCGASVQSDASFCGQCGANLSGGATSASEAVSMATNISSDKETGASESLVERPDVSLSSETVEALEPVSPSDVPEIPDLPELEPLVEPEPLISEVPDLDAISSDLPETGASTPETPMPIESDVKSLDFGSTDFEELNLASSEMAEPAEPPVSESSVSESSVSESPVSEFSVSESSGFESPGFESPVPSPSSVPASNNATQLQAQSVQLIHAQTNSVIDIPPNLAVIHIGKPNDRVPPDIDVSGFKDSEVVSRVHADIRVEGDSYYLEDVGSSNGTYVNNIPLQPGNRHKLRAGDRFALGKGDKVSFTIKISN